MIEISLKARTTFLSFIPLVIPSSYPFLFCLSLIPPSGKMIIGSSLPSSLSSSFSAHYPPKYQLFIFQLSPSFLTSLFLHFASSLPYLLIHPTIFAIIYEPNTRSQKRKGIIKLRGDQSFSYLPPLFSFISLSLLSVSTSFCCSRQSPKSVQYTYFQIIHYQKSRKKGKKKYYGKNGPQSPFMVYPKNENNGKKYKKKGKRVNGVSLNYVVTL